MAYEDLSGVPHHDGSATYVSDLTPDVGDTVSVFLRVPADFRLTTYPPPPSWAADAVLYQVFPDRFARSVEPPAPDWAIPQGWDDPVVGCADPTRW